MNDDLIKMFGVKQLLKDTVTDIIVEFDDGHQARLIAKGSGQSLRGVKWDNKRPDLIVCDDLENEELVLNKERRDNFRRWFSGTLLPCRSKDGIIRVVGTILHLDSQLSHFMPRLGRKDQPVYIDDLREIAHPRAIWHSARYRAHDKQLKISLWPEFKSIDWLKTERQSYIDQGLSDLWAQEMLNVPFDESIAPFRRRDFHEMEGEDGKGTLNYYISTDFATSDKQRSDFTVFLVSAMDDRGQLYIVDCIHERLESPDIVTTWWSLLEKYNPEMCFVEKGATWNMLKPLITNEMLKTGEFTLIEEIHVSTDKRSRTASIRARMRIGSVKFNKQSDWWPDFEEECLRFTGTGSSHDDQVDALSLLGLAINRFVEAPTPEEEQEEQYRDEIEGSGLWEQGRSEITGY